MTVINVEASKRVGEARAVHAERARQYRLRNPEKVAARVAVRTAIRTGQLVRLECCERCGKACKTEASHWDYSRVLDVEWLCRQCHEEKDLSSHCNNGHAMTPENCRWIMRPIGRQRICRACTRYWSAKYKAARKATAEPKPELCRNGHVRTPENTAIQRGHGRTYRRCKICRAEVKRAYMRRVAGR
jgi:hypothetical protein